jgi:hypothetical protein
MLVRTASSCVLKEAPYKHVRLERRLRTDHVYYGAVTQTKDEQMGHFTPVGRLFHSMCQLCHSEGRIWHWYHRFSNEHREIASRRRMTKTRRHTIIIMIMVDRGVNETHSARETIRHLLIQLVVQSSVIGCSCC